MVFLTTHEVYDTLTQSWSTAAAMPTARGCHVGAAIDGIVYAISGYNGSTHLTVNEAYDPQSNTWQTKAPIPTPRKGAGCAIDEDKIYVIGGSNTEYLVTCESYTPDVIGAEEEAGAAVQNDDRIEAIMTSRGITVLSAPDKGRTSKAVLYDINGRKVDVWEKPLARNTILRPNAGSSFPKGVYFLSVTTEGFRTVKKLVCVR
jgi:Kelch motif